MSLIRKYRQANGESLQELANLVGTTRSAIHLAEKPGRFLSFPRMVKLAKHWGIHAEDLYDEVDDAV